MDKQVVCGETANTITSRKVINLGTKEGKVAVTYLRKSTVM